LIDTIVITQIVTVVAAAVIMVPDAEVTPSQARTCIAIIIAAPTIMMAEMNTMAGVMISDRDDIGHKA
jgi:hypothetical protein